MPEYCPFTTYKLFDETDLKESLAVAANRDQAGLSAN